MKRVAPAFRDYWSTIGRENSGLILAVGIYAWSGWTGVAVLLAAFNLSAFVIWLIVKDR